MIGKTQYLCGCLRLLQLLREARKKTDLPAEEMADRLNTCASVVSEIESGGQQFDILELATFCKLDWVGLVSLLRPGAGGQGGAWSMGEFSHSTHIQHLLNRLQGGDTAARKDAETQINGFKSAREAMTKQVALLTKIQQGIEAKIAALQSSMVKLDSEIVAAKAMKQASAAMGDADSSLADNLNELERKIATLSADVQAELALETDRWSAANTEKTISDVDAFIRDSQTSTDIDRISNASTSSESLRLFSAVPVCMVGKADGQPMRNQ